MLYSYIYTRIYRDTLKVREQVVVIAYSRVEAERWFKNGLGFLPTETDWELSQAPVRPRVLVHCEE